MRTPQEQYERRLRKKARRKLSVYGKRNRRIANNGLAGSYAEYLASPRWLLIRAAVMERDDGKCQICGGQASCVHHNNYSQSLLRGRSIIGAFALCNSCHKFIEFDQQGAKCNMVEMRRRIKLLAVLKGREFVHPERRNDDRAKEILARLQKQLAELE